MALGALANAPGDKLLVVDCLLPAQVRQLGTGFTYLAPRQAIKTSGSDCEKRGGEYVASDRASGAVALRVWLPQAEQGDKIAQTYVGEIFEKGLGAQPDYQAAATWYRKAVKQDYSRAMINLGFLYEKGLGVEKDAVEALNLYRRAAGLDQAIRIDTGTPTDRDAELNELRGELERARQQLNRAKQELERERTRSKQELDKLRSDQKAAASAGDMAEMQRLEKALLEKEATTKRRESEIVLLEQAADRHREQLAALEKEGTALKARLDASERAAATARDELSRRQQTADQARAELARLQKDAQAQKGVASEAALARVRVMEDLLARRERELDEQRDKFAKLEKASAATRDQIHQPATLESKPGVPVVGPSIQLIDPELVVTRSPMVVPLRGELKYRDVVGRVLAPAGLLSLTVNDRTLVPDPNGLFKTRVDISPSATKVTFVAVDRAGSSARMDFLFQPGDSAAASVSAIRPAPAGVSFGRYHALVIGNQKYTALPKLETPEADAKVISELLSARYGFEVKTLLNATRYDILSELNRLRATLTDKDNLLVYYAGHGELDRVNQRGHWLPVDAEPNSDANWISSVAVTDILNAMSVKQAIVIADSCYAGALTRSSLGRLESGMSDEARTNWLKSIAKSRSRTVLTSGGVQPVLDGGGGRHSVFAQNLIRILSENTEILEAQRVYQELSARVLNAAMKVRFEQRPEYGPMRFAGHESGDFLFVPRTP
jgi:Caspase domain/Sel1 repeat